MKYVLSKASDMDYEKEIEIDTLDGLINLINETECGSVIINTKRPTKWDPTDRSFVYEPLDVTEILIYDDYVE